MERYDIDGACEGESGRCVAQMRQQADGAYVLYANAQAQLEAVRRERDFIATQRDDLSEALDAERATLQAERERSLKQAQEAMVVLVRAQLAEQELATLKALVGEKGGDGE